MGKQSELHVYMYIAPSSYDCVTKNLCVIDGDECS